MSDTRRAGGDTTTAASPAGPTGDAGSHTPRLVGVAWALLLVNTLGYTSVDLIIPIPGQRAQIDAFVDAARSGGPMPVPIDSLVATTRATLAVHTSLTTGAPVRLDAPAVIVPSPNGAHA